jgi:hypothetical protein
MMGLFISCCDGIGFRGKIVLWAFHRVDDSRRWLAEAFVVRAAIGKGFEIVGT